MSSEIPIDPSLEDFSISPSPEPGTQVAELGAGGGQEGDEGGFGGDGEVDARGEDEDYGAPGEEEGEGEGSNKRRRGNNPAGKNGHRPARTFFFLVPPISHDIFLGSFSIAEKAS